MKISAQGIIQYLLPQLQILKCLFLQSNGEKLQYQKDSFSYSLSTRYHLCDLGQIIHCFAPQFALLLRKKKKKSTNYLGGQWYIFNKHLSHLAQKGARCGCFINVTLPLSIKSKKRFGLIMLCAFREKDILLYGQKFLRLGLFQNFLFFHNNVLWQKMSSLVDPDSSSWSYFPEVQA